MRSRPYSSGEHLTFSKARNKHPRAGLLVNIIAREKSYKTIHLYIYVTFFLHKKCPGHVSSIICHLKAFTALSNVMLMRSRPYPLHSVRPETNALELIFLGLSVPKKQVIKQYIFVTFLPHYQCPEYIS